MKRNIGLSILFATLMALIGLTTPMPASAQGLNKSRTWDYGLGNPSFLSTYLTGQYDLTGDATGAAFQLHTNAGASIFGKKNTILNLDVSAHAYTVADMDASITLKGPFGFTIFDKEISRTKTPITIKDYVGPKDNKGKPKPIFDFHDDDIVFIGPVPVFTTIGVRGSIGENLSLNIEAGAIHGTIEPFIDTSAYADASTYYWLFHAGVEANLTLLRVGLPISAEAYFAPNYALPEPSWGIAWNDNTAINMNMLKGDISLYVKVVLFCYKFPFKIYRCDKEIFRYSLIHWPGLNLSKTIYSDDGWTSIGVPLPREASLSVDTVRAGGSDFTLLVNGSGFDKQALIYWDGKPRQTTYLSSSQLRTQVKAYEIGDPATIPVSVVNPGLLGGKSNALPFHVLLPPPSITHLTPGGATEKGADYELTLFGSYFIEGSTVYWNKIPLLTTHISDIELKALVPASYISLPGTIRLTVVQPQPYHGTSNALVYPIFPATAHLTSLRPFRVWSGSQSFTLNVHGSGFVNGSTVYWNGTRLQTTYISGVQLQAEVPSTHLTHDGARAVTVINPQSNGVNSTPSNPKTFIIAPLRFTITDLGTLPNYANQVHIGGINAIGQVAGDSDQDSIIGHAFLWDSIQGIQDLVPQAFFAFVAWPGQSTEGINRLSEVLVNYQPSNHEYRRPAIWQKGVLNDLGPQWVDAYAINDFSQIVGNTYPNAGIAVWQNYQVIYPGEGNRGWGTTPTAINNNGQIAGVGWDKDPNFGGHLYGLIWQDNKRQDIIDFGPTVGPPPGSNLSGLITGINDYGAVIGFKISTTWPILSSQAFLWHDNQLSYIGAPEDSSQAYGINNNGEVVGNSSPKGPFLYVAGTMQSLQNLIPANSGYNLVTADAINDSGQIAGTGFVNGKLHAILLTPDGSSGLPPDPPPSLAALTPSETTVGGTRLVITLDGSDFVPGTQAFWNGAALPTAFVSSHRLQALVTGSALTDAGQASIVVVNPGGEPSNLQIFTLLNRRASLSAITPTFAAAGNLDFTLTIAGSRFVPGSQVYWNGSSLTTQYISATKLTATVPASMIAEPGVAAITVFTPGPGGGNSGAMFMGIQPPAPRLANMNPTSIQMNASDFKLIVTGSGFDKTSVIYWDDAPLQTNYISPTQLSATVTSASLSNPGIFPIRVKDTTPGAWASNALQFTVVAPQPVLSRLSKSNASEGAPGFILDVSGTGFVDGAQVMWNGAPLPTTFVSDTQLSASVSGSALVTAGPISITVENPIPNGGESNALPFAITPAPEIDGLTPEMVRAGSAGFTLNIAGAGFVKGATVQWNGTVLQTTFVSDTQLSAMVPATSIASAGTALLTVVNPDGGTADPFPFTVYDQMVPAPHLTSLDPTSTDAGSVGFLLTITGSGFVNTSTATWNGLELDGSWVSDTQMIVFVPAEYIASPGSAIIVVSNPSDNGVGGGVSNPLTFTVK